MNKLFFCLLGFCATFIVPLSAEVVFSAPLQARELSFGNLLNWQTSLEENVEHYDVEKSFNGIDFENIGTVEAITSNSGKNSLMLYRLILLAILGLLAFSCTSSRHINGSFDGFN